MHEFTDKYPSSMAYLKHKVATPQFNIKTVRAFIHSCAQLRRNITLSLFNKDSLSDLQDLDQQACLLSFALIAYKWLPNITAIHSFSDLSTTLEQAFPKSQRKKGGTLELFAPLSKTLKALKRFTWPQEEIDAIVGDFLKEEISLKEEYFGRAYEEIRKKKAVIQDNELIFVEAPDRKEHGKYYTPEDVTQLMVQKSISQWMQAHALESITIDTKLNVLDPTVGAGAFLLEMVRGLEKRFPNDHSQDPLEILQYRRYIIQHWLFGFDLDAEALQVCQLSLWLLAYPHIKGLKLNAHFLHGDVLDIDPKWFNRFHILIGNPPYVTVKKGSSAYQKAHTRKLVSSDSQNLYAYVSELALKLLHPEGTLSLIIPLGITNSPKMSSLRQVVKTHNRQTEILNFGMVPGYIFNQGKMEGTSKQAISQRCSIVTINSKKPFVITTSARLRWLTEERPVLFQHLHTQAIPQDFDIVEQGIPNLGTAENLEIFNALISSDTKIQDLTQKTPSAHTALVVFKAVRYFIHADRSNLSRAGVVLHPQTESAHRLLYVFLNSNLFYWYWRILGGDQGVSDAFVRSTPIPTLPKEELDAAYERLCRIEKECAVYKLNAGQKVPNVNFNIRQDVLLQNDLLFLKQLKLPDTHVAHLFYSKWPALTKRDLNDCYLEKYSVNHHPRNVFPHLSWDNS